MDIKVVQSQNEIYQKQKLLGEGAFGKAYLVRKKSDNQLLVIKEMNIEHMSEQQKKQTIKQAQILRNLNHPNIVKFVEVYVTKQNKLKIVMEYAQCGDLSKAISENKKAKKYFQQNWILDWFTQICLAIKHVHDRKILHRDIKGQNIFITKTNTLKLGDFGIARVLNKTMEKARTVVGTPYYLSPQIIENKPYSFQSDIWSIGVVLYELCALTHPFTATSLQFLALKIVKGSFPAIPNQYSKDLRSLVNSMLSLDPNKRPTINEIFKNPLIQDRIKNFLTQTKRDHEFSHTILHNHKVEILTNRLVQIKQQKDFQKQRLKLKQQEEALKQKILQKKNQERIKGQQDERQKIMQKERIERQKQREIQRQRQKEKQDQSRRQTLEKQKQRRDFQRKQSVLDEQRRKQEDQRRLQRQYDDRNKIAKQTAEKRKQEQQIQRLRNQHAELMYRQSQRQEQSKKVEKMKKVHDKQVEQERKKKQLQQFARKQFFQNQQIMKRAKQRARQQEQGYSNNNNETAQHQQKLQNQQKLCNLGNKRSEQNFHHKNKKIQQQQIQRQYGAAKKYLSPIEDFAGKQQQQRKHLEARQKMKKDRQNFMRNKNSPKGQLEDELQSEIYARQPQTLQAQKDLKTIKAAKWQRPKSRGNDGCEQEIVQRKEQGVQQNPLKDYEQSYNFMQQAVSPKDEQNFNEYLVQLENILENMNKKVDALQSNQKKSPIHKKQAEGNNGQKQSSPQKIAKYGVNNQEKQKQEFNLADMPEVDEVIYREDDQQTFELSLTADFKKQGNLKSNFFPQIQESTDLDYFSNFSKLQTLKMNLQDKFGTDKFVQLYRFLENQMEQKGLEAFSGISGIVNQASNKFDIDQNLLTDSFTLLLTLIHMEEKMMGHN